MKYIFIFVFILTFTLFGTSIGYTKVSPLYTHLTYMFQHAGIVHLAMNSLAFIGMFRTLEKFISKWTLSLLVTTISFVSSFISMYDIPTVGASAMIYSMIGIFIGITTFCTHIKIANIKKYLLFISVIAISLTISLFKSNSNFILHLISMAVGVITSIPISLYKNHHSL
jgi:membrane associated rhomboid family serine protease